MKGYCEISNFESREFDSNIFIHRNIAVDGFCMREDFCYYEGSKSNW